MLRYQGYKLLCIGRDVVRFYVATGAKVEFVHLVATLRALHRLPSTDKLNVATSDTLATPRVSEYESVEVLAADFVASGTRVVNLDKIIDLFPSWCHSPSDESQVRFKFIAHPLTCLGRGRG